MKLFIHGVPDTGFMWTPLIDALGLADADYLAPTMPGFDGSLPDGFAATQAAYLEWVSGRLTAAAATGPVDIVGHDWGAPLVAIAALSRPDLVRSWTVINAVPEPTYEWHSTAKIWQTPVLGELFMLMGTRAKFHDTLVKAGMPETIADHEAARIDGPMKRSILRLYRSARQIGGTELDFSPIASRGCVLWGRGDPFVPVKYAERFSDRWNIPLHVVDDAGHWGLCQRPDVFAAHLRTHWQRVE